VRASACGAAEGVEQQQLRADFEVADVTAFHQPEGRNL
jgi:hypothetical protein